MKTTTFLVTLLLVQAPLLGGTAGYAQAPGQTGPLDFLVQSVCLDPAGKPTSTLPVDPACTTRRLQRSDDPEGEGEGGEDSDRGGRGTPVRGPATAGLGAPSEISRHRAPRAGPPP